MDAAIGTLPRRLVGSAVGVLSRAFRHDPILTYYLGQGPRRAVANQMFFADIVQSALPFGHVYAKAASNRVQGVAVWKPPGATAGSRTTASVRRELIVRALYPRAARGLFAGFAGLEALHPTVPHWYLMFVAIDIGLQSQGMGSRLLTPVLQLADADRMLCYLETPFRRTHVFYQRLGFQVASESHPFPGAPPVWRMIREPRNAAG